MNAPAPALRSRTGGFSLVELVFTLALLGIMLSLAAPNLRGWTNRTRIDSALNELSGDFAYARMLAVRSGQGAWLTINAAGTGYTVTAVGTGVAKRVDLQADYPGLQLIHEGSPTNDLMVRFDSRGYLLGSDGTVQAQHSGLTGTLRFLPSGRAFREN